MQNKVSEITCALRAAETTAAVPRNESPKPKARLWGNTEAADYLGVKCNTLEVWRSTKRHGIPFIRVGRLIKYRQRDLDAWLASRTVSTEQA